MKSQFLVFKNITVPEEGLRIANREEWTQIMKENSLLPYENRRCFIKDEIIEGNELDRIYIETTKEEYDEWHMKQMRKKRKTDASPKFVEISGDVVTQDGLRIFDAIDSQSQSPEDNVYEKMRLEKLRDRLATWKYWSVFMLDIYLTGERKQVVKIVAEAYGVDQKTARKWRAAFVEFVADYYDKNY